MEEQDQYRSSSSAAFTISDVIGGESVDTANTGRPLPGSQRKPAALLGGLIDVQVVNL